MHYPTAANANHTAFGPGIRVLPVLGCQLRPTLRYGSIIGSINGSINVRTNGSINGSSSTSSSGSTGDSRRPIGCPDLYNMTEAINQSSTWEGTLPVVVAEESACKAEGREKSVHNSVSPDEGHQEDARDMQYYSGLLTTDVTVDNGAASTDMLKRNLQLAAGVAALLSICLLAFMVANHLL